MPHLHLVYPSQTKSWNDKVLNRCPVASIFPDRSIANPGLACSYLALSCRVFVPAYCMGSDLCDPRANNGLLEAANRPHSIDVNVNDHLIYCAGVPGKQRIGSMIKSV